MRWGEGGLVAAVLLIALVFSFVVVSERIPAEETVLSVHAASYEELRCEEMVDINGDAVEKISRLPGIGEVLAQRIVAYREEYGPFAFVEELLRVEGLGEGKLDAIRNEIYVN